MNHASDYGYSTAGQLPGNTKLNNAYNAGWDAWTAGAAEPPKSDDELEAEYRYGYIAARTASVRRAGRLVRRHSSRPVRWTTR